MSTATQFDGLKIGLIAKNIKTNKNWIITEFISSYSTIGKKNPDQFEVRLSNGTGKFLKISVESLRKNYLC